MRGLGGTDSTGGEARRIHAVEIRDLFCRNDPLGRDLLDPRFFYSITLIGGIDFYCLLFSVSTSTVSMGI